MKRENAPPTKLTRSKDKIRRNISLCQEVNGKRKLKTGGMSAWEIVVKVVFVLWIREEIRMRCIRGIWVKV